MDMFALYGSEYVTLQKLIMYTSQEMGTDEFQIQVMSMHLLAGYRTV